MTTSASTQPKKNPAVSPYTKRQMDADMTRIAAEGGTERDVGNMLYQKYGYTLPGFTPDPVQPKPGRAVDVAVPLMPGGGPVPLSYSLGALQGLTLGTGVAGMGSIMGWVDGRGAQWGRDAVRDVYASLAEQHPMRTMAGEVTGTALLTQGTGVGPAIARNMAGRGALARTAMGAGLGGLGAGAYAAGEARGGVGERLDAGLGAGAVGTGIGAMTAISPMVALMTLGAGVGAATNKEHPVLGAVGGVGTSLLAGKAASPKVSGMIGRVRDRLRGMAHAEGSTPAKARTLLGEWLTAEHGSIQNAMAKIDAAEASGQPLAVADLLGPDAPTFLAELEAKRSPTMNALTSTLRDRQDGQQGRIMQQMMRSFRLGSANAHDAADLLVTAREQQAAPLYEAAWDEVVPVTDKLRNLLSVPQVREAYQRGAKLDALRIANETGGAGQSNIPELPDDLRTLIGLPVRALHNIKRGVRDMATEAAGSGKSLTRESQRDLFGLATQARELASEASPNYRGANALFGGHANSLNALQLGKGGQPIIADHVVEEVGTRPRFVNRTPEQVAADLKDIDAADKKLYILGALQDVDELLSSQLGKDPQLLAKMGLYGTSGRETRFTKSLRALFDDPDQADELLERLRNEAMLARVPKGQRGRAMIREFHEVAGNARRDATLASGVPGKLGRAVDAVGTVLSTAEKDNSLEAELADEISNLLLGGVNGPAEARATVNGLLPYVPRTPQPRGYRPLVPLIAGQQVSPRRRPTEQARQAP